MRGSVLRNTEFVWGLVLYCGSNTKIMKNLKKAGLKTSTLEKKLNKFTFAAFIFNMFLLISSVLLELKDYFYIVEKQTKDPEYNWYLDQNYTPDSTAQVIFN